MNPESDQYSHYVNSQVDRNYTIRGRQTNQITIPEFIHIGRVKTSRPWNCFEHRHESTEFLYVVEGTVRSWINRKAMDISAGGIYFVEPGQLHEEESLEVPLDFYYLKFNIYSLRGKVLKLGLPPEYPPAHQVIPDAEGVPSRLFEAIFREATENRPGGKEIIESHILTLFWESRRRLGLIDDAPLVVPTRQREIVSMAQRFLQAQIGEPFSLEVVAAHCSVSPDYLSQLFREIAGLSPVQFSAKVKGEAAKEMLQNSSKSIKEIAFALGFQDEYYFSRRFKLLEKVTPSEFRRALGSSQLHVEVPRQNLD